MGLLQQYDPPACLPDFDPIPGQREAWHRYVDEMFVDLPFGKVGASSAPNAIGTMPPSFYDASRWDPGDVIERDLVWNAFPNELLRRFGRRRAMREADRLWPLSSYPLNWRFDPGRPVPPGSPYPRKVSFRPTTEYCEWHVDRRGPADAIQRVTFTCEPPEYWQALFGGRMPYSSVICPGDRGLLLDLYRKLVHPDIGMQDLLVQRPFRSPLGDLEPGDYNPYNPWNVGRGIVHLTAPPNSLRAEIMLAAQATLNFRDVDDQPVERAEAIVAGGNIGSANRHSDVAIAGGVNALARQKRRSTLANPVGIYIDHIDLAGWELPDRIPPEDCVRVVRGGGRRVTRLVVEVPSSKFPLSDLRIGGVPVTCGGQIAECISVRLRVAASRATGFEIVRQTLVSSGFVDPKGGAWVYQSEEGDIPPGMVPAFGHVPDPAARPPGAAAGAFRSTRAV